ncbi:DUF4347 domain-containing protein [Acaryochloris sp. IP29b_bin.148]|uniref:DUF4347 domain-containing protein n=1 Tax=Acaryochloris sp. IP29b_bin.148 TaxID=2969218 RepID=UPI003454A2B0
MNYSSLKSCQQLVVIDPSIDVPKHLIDGVVPGTAVVMLNPEEESIPQITKALRSHGPISGVHLRRFLGKNSRTKLA